MRSLPAEAVAPAVLGASVIGDAHVRSALPCQDAFRTLISNDVVVLTVADGLGSALRSDVGASAASEAAASRALELAHDPMRAAMEGMIAAREALESVASAEDCSLSDLACTLLVAVANARGSPPASRVALAHIGDGAAVGLWGDEPYLLSPPAQSEYLNVVDPLTADDWADNVRTVCSIDGIDGLALFTDGCHHAAVRRSTAHAGFFRPLFDFARSGVSRDDGEAALVELLSGKKMSEHSDDDKTLVLAVLTGGRGGSPPT